MYTGLYYLSREYTNCILILGKQSKMKTSAKSRGITMSVSIEKQCSL